MIEEESVSQFKTRRQMCFVITSVCVFRSVCYQGGLLEASSQLRFKSLRFINIRWQAQASDQFH